MLKLFTFAFARGRHTLRTIAIAPSQKQVTSQTFGRWQQYIVVRPVMKLLMELMKINEKKKD